MDILTAAAFLKTFVVPKSVLLV